MAPSRYDWKIVDWDVKPQHNQSWRGSFRDIFRYFSIKTYVVGYNMHFSNEYPCVSGELKTIIPKL